MRQRRLNERGRAEEPFSGDIFSLARIYFQRLQADFLNCPIVIIIGRQFSANEGYSFVLWAGLVFDNWENNMKPKLSSFAIVILTFVLASGSALAQRPDGISYEVWVKSSFGTEFPDCGIFGNDGVLWIVGLGIPQAFEQKDLGESEVFWQSVTFTGFGFSFAFSGMATGNETDGMIKGDAISEFGDTFTFKGKPGDCGFAADAFAPVTSSPWMQ